MKRIMLWLNPPIVLGAVAAYYFWPEKPTSAPEVDGPVRLVQPRVLYEFADPKLEQLSAGQKILLRIGRANELKVKGKLREIRQALVSMKPQ